MRAKVLQILTVCIIVLGIIGTPSLGQTSYGLHDCGTGGQTSCGGG